MSDRKKRLKMWRLRRFWPTLACTIPTARMERFVGYASGVVKRSRQGINHRRFVTCWKLGVVILPFALPGFPSFMRIDTVHCMTKVRNIKEALPYTNWWCCSAETDISRCKSTWKAWSHCCRDYLSIYHEYSFCSIGAIWHSYDGPYNDRRETLHLQHTICSIFTAIHLIIHPEHGHPQVSQCHCWNGHSRLLSLWEYSRCSCWVVKV